jgi:hypothetical protein
MTSSKKQKQQASAKPTHGKEGTVMTDETLPDRDEMLPDRMKTVEALRRIATEQGALQGKQRRDRELAMKVASRLEADVSALTDAMALLLAAHFDAIERRINQLRVSSNRLSRSAHAGRFFFLLLRNRIQITQMRAMAR